MVSNNSESVRFTNDGTKVEIFKDYPSLVSQKKIKMVENVPLNDNLLGGETNLPMYCAFWWNEIRKNRQALMTHLFQCSKMATVSILKKKLMSLIIVGNWQPPGLRGKP